MTHEEMEAAIVSLTLHCSNLGEQLRELDRRWDAIIEQMPTLRDYFAAAAMEGLVRDVKALQQLIDTRACKSGADIRNACAKWAYQQADVMIAASEMHTASEVRESAMFVPLEKAMG